MEQTVSINLAGLVFHIDKPAYDNLEQYLTAIRNQLAADPNRNDILQDVENRLSELFEQRLNSRKEAITQADVEAVKAEMGDPAFFAQEQEQAQEQPEATPDADQQTRFIQRDSGNGIIGGVCAGIGDHFGFDPVWLRLAFILGVIFAGTGILIYLVLWLLLPAKKKPELTASASEPASSGDRSAGKRIWSDSKRFLTNLLIALEQGLGKLLNACKRATARLQQS